MRQAGQQPPNGYYNIERMLKVVNSRGGVVGVWGSCMDGRGLADRDLAASTRRSSLDEVTEWTLWADKVLVF